MHKKTREGNKNPKAHWKLCTRCQKGDCGVVGWSMRQSGVYIASVGSLSGQCINAVRTRAASEMSRLVTRVRMINLTVRPMLAGHVRTSTGPVWMTKLHPRPDTKERLSGHSTLKHQKTEENLQKSNFSQVSFRTRMYNPLITQSENISKLNRDI
jgi:hypothetical protein